MGIIRKLLGIGALNELLAEEAKEGRAYSDYELSEKLSSSRRTITKYRAKYGIPSKSERNRAYLEDVSRRFQIQVLPLQEFEKRE